MLNIDIFSSSAIVIEPGNQKKESKILQDSCKKNSILARILQEEFNSCKNLAR